MSQEKRDKIRFLMTVLSEQYWDVSPKQRLQRLKLVLEQKKPLRQAHRLEQIAL